MQGRAANPKRNVQRPMSNVRCFNKSARRTNDNSVLRARPPHNAERLRLSEVGFYLFHEASPHESEAQPPVSGRDSAVRQSLTALCGGRAASIIHPLRRTACALGLLSPPTGSRFCISFALKSTQRIWLRGSTNTEPGAIATGCNLQYTNRSMREFRDEHRDIHNRLSCKGFCNQTSSRSLSLPVPYLCIAASR